MLGLMMKFSEGPEETAALLIEGLAQESRAFADRLAQMAEDADA